MWAALAKLESTLTKWLAVWVAGPVLLRRVTVGIDQLWP